MLIFQSQRLAEILPMGQKISCSWHEKIVISNIHYSIKELGCNASCYF